VEGGHSSHQKSEKNKKRIRERERDGKREKQSA
jgi:hypothetical protein